MVEYLITGARGQLGSDLVAQLEQRGKTAEVMAVDIDTLDICDHLAVRRALTAGRPRVVFNCAAYHQVDHCETHAAEAFACNAVAVHNMATACEEIDATLVLVGAEHVYT